jgi:hypothetical protein
LSPALRAGHCAIMVVDVAGFSNPARTLLHQVDVQKGLYQILQDAFAESGISWDLCVTEDRGDGVMILIPPEVPKILLADQLADRVVAALRRYNAVRSPEASVQLRISLHFGEVLQNRNGVVSPAVVFAFRILDAPVAKSALKESAGMVAFIASDLFFREVIAQDAAADPASYRQIPVDVKEVSSGAWLSIRGGSVQLRNLPSPVGMPSGMTMNTPDVIPAPPDLPEQPDQPEQPDVQAVLPSADFHVLSKWLSEVTVAHLSTVVRRAAGPGAPLPCSTNAWEVFGELNDVNAGPDGVPPALVFLALLAEQVGGEFKTDVMAWVTGEARRLRMEPKLRQRVAAAAEIPDKPKLHLLIAVEPYGPDGNRDWWVSCWRQDDPDMWPPARTDVGEVALGEIEFLVDKLVMEAEQAWCDESATVVLEFLMPRSLLGLDILGWRKDHHFGNPRPLHLDYPIVLRSLERMRARHWHRVWQDRWRSLMRDPLPWRVHFGQPADIGEPYRVDALLSDPRWVAMALSAAPTAVSEPGMDEFAAALQCGLPALVWHPHASPETLREVLIWLLDGHDLTELPERAHAARRDAFLTSPSSANVNISGGLVVLWDDSRRRVALDQPAVTSSATAKESADER